ncbi:PAS domain-containing protein [Rhizobium cauense]|uniref:PAS domain-containing protein n=1 Tax=Rhizobium cauense TaxID=1166683 RepID=UPI001C6EEED4|nr:PAS domain-containing protein [Rhizobium cauense]MBW9118115.1 PAS domain-containing protein [Rhizobium cauense]
MELVLAGLAGGQRRTRSARGTTASSISIIQNGSACVHSNPDCSEPTDQYKAVFDAIDDGACIIEQMPSGSNGPRDYRYLAVNPAMRRMVGVRDLTGRSVRDSFPDKIEELYDDFDRVLATGEAARVERECTPQGLVFDIAVSRLVDSPGCLLAIIRDVTGRRRDQEALRRSEEQYRQLYESMDEGFCIVEVLFDENDKACDYRFLQTNPAFERQSGLLNAVGRRMRELAPDHEQHWFETYGEIAKTGQPSRFEDGAAALGRWFDVYAFRIGDAKDRHVAVLFRDILPRKRAERELKQSEERTRALVNASSDIVYRMSPDWREMRQLDGRGILTTTEGPTVRWIEEYILPEDQVTILAAIDRAIEARDVFELEHRVRKSDGSVGWAFSRAIPVFDEHGAISEWFGMASDVTVRRQAEEQRVLLNSEMSHRLKNILAVANSVASQTLRSAPDMPTAQKALAERLAALARAQDILVTGHKEAGTVSDLVEVATSIHAERERINTSGPVVRLGPKASLALSLIIHELCTNAIKYGSLSERIGHVHVSWSVEDAQSNQPPLFRFDWVEQDGPQVRQPHKSSFGTRLIALGLGGGQYGKVDLNYDSSGLRCHIVARLDYLVAENA